LIPESINLAYDKSCRISSDLQLFLGTNQPGRQFSFISLSELLYWERFRSLKTKHELYSGHVIYASPLLRAPNGVSVFSQYLSNPKVIRTLCDVLKNTQEKNPTCYFHKLLPLSILYSNPTFTPKTALQLSLEKNLLNSFNNMLRLLVDRTDVAISRFFVDSMKLVIDSNSPVVNDFLNSSFIITQQFDEPIDLNIPES